MPASDLTDVKAFHQFFLPRKFRMYDRARVAPPRGHSAVINMESRSRLFRVLVLRMSLTLFRNYTRQVVSRLSDADVSFETDLLVVLRLAAIHDKVRQTTLNLLKLLRYFSSCCSSLPP